MIHGAEILTLAEDWAVAPAVVERDYVSGWVAAGIAAHDLLGPAWSFTGGTYLRKCVLETYRFPPTLDFTLTDGSTMSPMRLARAFDEIVAWVEQRTGMLLPQDLVQFELGRNARGELVGRGYVHYHGPLATISREEAEGAARHAPLAQARWTAKVAAAPDDLTLSGVTASGAPAAPAALAAAGLVPGADPTEGVRLDYGLPFITIRVTASDPLILPVVSRRIVHPYSDAPVQAPAHVQAADGAPGLFVARGPAYEELFCERLITLARDGRPGDLYDVAMMFRDEPSRPAAASMMRTLGRKCALKGIGAPTQWSLARLADPLRAAWPEAAARELGAAPPFDQLWRTLAELFSWLETGHVAQTPPAIPLGSGHLPFRPALAEMRAQDLPGASFVERIRMAALNRLCIDLDYETAPGDCRTRTVEPYALRRTARGDTLLMALHRDVKNLRCYRLDRVRDVRVTTRDFTPRFAVDPGPPHESALPDGAPHARPPQDATPPRRDEPHIH